MKRILATVLFSVTAIISSVGYADSAWYALDFDLNSAAIDGYHWRMKCTRAREDWNPADLILDYKR
jgi:hypothetical protein